MNYPYIIASYPRSGSTWFRFVLCHLFYGGRHDFDSVNKIIPPIDHLPGLMAGVSRPMFYKTHGLSTAVNVIYLYRHVGDVLESEWWYKKKMYQEERSLERYIIDTDFGKEWRVHVDHYYPALMNFSYEDLGETRTYLVFGKGPRSIDWALEKSSFENMQKAEEKGLGGYPTGDPSIKFCRFGNSGCWERWEPDLKKTLIEKNQGQLKKLGYLP